MPRQLANRPRAHPPPHTLSRHRHAVVPEYQVLPEVSLGCPCAGGRLPTCYSAVRHFIRAPKCALTVRLACVRRAASVHPEPGSNSPFKFNSLSQEVRGDLFCTGERSVSDFAVLGFAWNCRVCVTLRYSFACLSRRSHRSQYPVFKVRRAGPELCNLASARARREKVIYAPALWPAMA